MTRKHLWIGLALFAPLLHAQPTLAQATPGAGVPATPGGSTPSGGAPSGNSGASPGGMSPGMSPGGTTPGSNAPGTSPPSGAAPGGAVPYVPPGGALYAPPYGLPTGPFTDQNAYLPSSSQPSNDTGRANDHFDLTTRAGGAVVHGDPNASFNLGSRNVESGEMMPPVYVVRRGDTLWELCDRYFHNPWDWPRIWSYNPGLQNPHWIYPGDQIRMEPGAPAQAAAGPLAAKPGATSQFVRRQSRVAPNTIFLRDQGYIEDNVKDVWGEIGGSPDDQLLLSEGDNSYIDVKPGHDVSPGEELTIFRPLKSNLRGDAKGTLVAILGTARVDKWDPQTRIARAKLIESLDVIERGSFVGPVRRRFEVVPPVRNEVELWGHVAASLYPHVLFGQNQVVFIDKGQQEGLVSGNRLFVVTRGDEYRKTMLGASEFAASHVQYENEEPAKIEQGGALGKGDDAKYPEEVIGEIRVLSTREHTAACLVVASTREIEPGQRVVARRGY